MAKRDKAPPPEKKPKRKNEPEAAAEVAAAKPQRGLAIGDNFGWTGKLPATLLFEHAQKQRWEKVAVDMRKSARGFIGVVTLRWRNPKTNETVSVQMVPHSDTYTATPTANEARHYAATYALHRIGFAKNMKMVLPTVFRDYWGALERARAEMLRLNRALHDTLYCENPFAVVLAQREREARREKERQREQQKARPSVAVQIAPKVPKVAALKAGASKAAASAAVAAVAAAQPAVSPPPPTAARPRLPKFPAKVWAAAPFLDFPPDLRTKIETAIKRHIDWGTEATPAGAPAGDAAPALLALGFRPPHVAEALTYTAHFTDALEWLLFHIPEDDLPHYFAKSDRDLRVSLKVLRDLQREYAVKRVQQSGVDEDEALAALAQCGGDEQRAIVLLTHSLAAYRAPPARDDDVELWAAEIEGIELISDRSAELSPDRNVATIALHPRGIAPALLSVRLVRSPGYPDNIPGVQLVVNDAAFRLAIYIRLAVVRRLLEYVQSAQLVGSCFVFSLVEWLEANIAAVIADPGPLSAPRPQGAVAAAAAAAAAPRALRRARRLPQADVDRLAAQYRVRQTTPAMEASVAQRRTLPAWQKQAELVATINANRVTIVTGETGSGKSTQIVQFVLDDLARRGDFALRIVCTQPRRISTIGLAERISDERCDRVGRETGYVIRGENKTGPDTRILFVTTGVLLRMLQADPDALNADYVFVDEVHERLVDSDFLLILLRRVLAKFAHLRVVLMSATIDTATFANFFNTPLNHIHIEGRTFPIQDHYLDSVLQELDYSVRVGDEVVKARADSHYFASGTLNYELVAKLCAHIDARAPAGLVLIFLPGVLEIARCIRALERESLRFWCLPLHSALSLADQRRVFAPPPRGARKIVVATNVAETSITIPDCVVVVDLGRSKLMHFDPHLNATKLVENWCLRAEVGQRRGRLGRITAGTCYHLYTEATFEAMAPQPVPEIKRTRLENLYLVVKLMGINEVEAFLNSGLDPPPPRSLLQSRQFLVDLGALTERGAILPLGRYLSLLPTDLQCGKLLILGCILGCLDTCLTIAATSIAGSPFKATFEERDLLKRVQAAFARSDGDLVAIVRAYNEYTQLKQLLPLQLKRFLGDNHLSYLTMRELGATRDQYLNILQDIGFVPLRYRTGVPSRLNRNNDRLSIVRACVTGAFYPQLARVQLPDRKYFQTAAGAVSVDPDARKTKFWIRNEAFLNRLREGKQPEEGVFPATRAFIHPSLVLFEIPENDVSTVVHDYTNEDGSLDFARASSDYKVDFTPAAGKSLPSSVMLRAPFMVYNSSSHTSKLYLRDVTPTSTLAVLLFGGHIGYDLNDSARGHTAPGIVLDLVWPIRTWCKNGVLIKRLRHLFDGVIEDRLSNPYYSEDTESDVLDVIEGILHL
jgi:ATP-dependent RNA helicase DHX57